MVKEGTWLPQHVDGDNTKENGAVDISRAKLFSAIYRALIRSQAPCKCFRCVFFLGSLAQDHTTTQGHRWSLKPLSSPAPLATVGPASSPGTSPTGGASGQRASFRLHHTGFTTRNQDYQRKDSCRKDENLSQAPTTTCAGDLREDTKPPPEQRENLRKRLLEPPSACVAL